MENGFKPWTWYAAHLEDALGYGGSYLFEVAVPKCFGRKWQVHYSKAIPASRIVSLTIFSAEECWNNPLLRHNIEMANMTEYEKEILLPDGYEFKEHITEYGAWIKLRK